VYIVPREVQEIQMADGINKPKFPPRKSGPVRQAGQLTGGDGATGRGAVARGGTLSSSKGEGGESGVHYQASYAEGTKQKFRPTPGKGSVK
jgi:hypothetical protein